MPAVVNSAEAMQRFASQLRQYQKALEESTYGMESHVRQIGDEWRDDGYQRFLNEWETSRRAVDRLLDACDEYTVHLLRLADDLRRVEETSRRF